MKSASDSDRGREKRKVIAVAMLGTFSGRRLPRQVERVPTLPQSAGPGEKNNTHVYQASTEATEKDLFHEQAVG